MSWLDRFREASFRNVKFYVESVETGTGRKLAVHEPIGQDFPIVQDMGLAKNDFTVEGYVLGDDYLTQRDLLLEACEKEGPGELVHPYYGSFIVSCLSVKFRDNSRERRIGRFTINFIKTKKSTIPVVDYDTTEKLYNKRNEALDTVNATFLKAYNIVNKPYVFSKKAAETVNQFLLQVESNRRKVNSSSDFVRTLKNTTAKVVDYIYKPANLIQSIIELISYGTTSQDLSFEATADNARMQFNEISKLFEFQPISKYHNDDPAVLIANSIQQASVVSCAGLLGVIEYDSSNDALLFRNVVLKKIDNLVTTITDDDLYTSFYSLREAVVEDIEARASKLSSLTNLSLQEALPALVLSNRLYGTISQEDNILKRNTLKHPGFVPGGINVEVLTNVTE